MATALWTLAAGAAASPQASREDGGSPPPPKAADPAVASGLEVDLGDGVSMRFVEIDSGRFTMGSPEEEAGRNDDETQHAVTISKAFLLGQTEVTQAQWQAVMGTNPSYFEGNPNRPVERVTWYDAIEFCNRLTAMANRADARLGLTPCYRISKIERAEGGGQIGIGPIRSAEVELIEGANGYRLPTEAEWEYACRAGTTTAWSFGNDRSRLGEHAWFASNSGKEPFDADAMVSEGDVRAFLQKLFDNRCSTKPVATRKPNAWGLFDMHGNVWEWCWDWYGEYPSGSASDPDGPRSGAFRVLRGGSWYGDSCLGRASYRLVSNPGFDRLNYGFRAARTP